MKNMHPEADILEIAEIEKFKNRPNAIMVRGKRSAQRSKG